MELSQIKAREASRLGIKQEELVMADLMCIGYSEEDAFAATHIDASARGGALKSNEINDLLRKPEFKKALNERKALYTQNGISVDVDVDDDELLDKRTTAKLILRTALKLPVNSKERIEGLMKYSELMRYKNDDVEGSVTDNIHFFLPLKCSQCPLLENYNRKKKESGETQTRPDEMGNMINFADTAEDKE